jgi:cation:H+ antiporter
MLSLLRSSELEKWWALASTLDPWFSLALFFGASFLMIWRLGAMEKKGLEGTVLGTLIMPYCSGFSNLVFAYVLGRSGGSGSQVLENCLVNNVTNLTLLIGLPALFCSMTLYPPQKKQLSSKQSRLGFLSLLLTLIALMFFAGVAWALGRDGKLDFADGLVLVGLFFFWQLFHVFDVLKNNVHQKRRLSSTLVVDLLLIAAGAYGTYLSIERLVDWIPRGGTGVLAFENLGWLSGILMVMPNALLAFYYASSGRTDIVYSSQAGDGHMCIPMCIGLFALFSTIQIPNFFNLGIFIILGSGLIHLLFMASLKRLPRYMGAALTVCYVFFIYQGFIAL